MPKQSLVDMLNYYGELQSDIVEELFEDGKTGNPETEGTNRTGTYIVCIKLSRDIPELLPVSGRRIWISYR